MKIKVEDDINVSAFVIKAGTPIEVEVKDGNLVHNFNCIIGGREETIEIPLEVKVKEDKNE